MLTYVITSLAKKYTISKITGAITCGADQFQCKSGICAYTANSNCHGPCIRSNWRNDGTKDCTDGSDEGDLDYDVDDLDLDYDFDDGHPDFGDIALRFNLEELKNEVKEVVMPPSNSLRIKVI